MENNKNNFQKFYCQKAIEAISKCKAQCKSCKIYYKQLFLE